MAPPASPIRAVLAALCVATHAGAALAKVLEYGQDFTEDLCVHGRRQSPIPLPAASALALPAALQTTVVLPTATAPYAVNFGSGIQVSAVSYIRRARWSAGCLRSEPRGGRCCRDQGS